MGITLASGGADILHLYWGRSRPLSWLRLQTVRTFAALNPGWQIKVWTRDVEPVAPYWSSHEQRNPYTGRCYFDALASIPGVIIAPAPLALKLPDVPFSDYLRWSLLATEGGFWSDFDIVFTRPMSDLGPQSGAFLIQYPCGAWPIGFLGALDDKGRWFFEQVRLFAHTKIHGASGYQDLGCVALQRIAKHQHVVKQSRQWVYPESKIAAAMRAYFDPDSGYAIPEDCIGFHWYAGAEKAAQFENAIDPDHLTTSQQQTAIIRQIRAVA